MSVHPCSRLTSPPSPPTFLKTCILHSCVFPQAEVQRYERLLKEAEAQNKAAEDRRTQEVWRRDARQRAHEEERKRRLKEADRIRNEANLRKAAAAKQVASYTVLQTLPRTRGGGVALLAAKRCKSVVRRNVDRMSARIPI